MSETVKANSLSVQELLTAVYEGLNKKHNGKVYKFEHQVQSEIADDSDHHRTRVGYIGYSEALVIMLGEKQWVIGNGIKCGRYPGDEFKCDLAISSKKEWELQKRFQARLNNSEETEIEVLEPDSKEYMEYLRESLNNYYFRKSLIIGMSDGNIGVNERGLYGGFARLMEEIKLPGYIANQLKINDEYLSASTLLPIVTSAVRYEAELVEPLIDAISKFLEII